MWRQTLNTSLLKAVPQQTGSMRHETWAPPRIAVIQRASSDSPVSQSCQRVWGKCGDFRLTCCEDGGSSRTNTRSVRESWCVWKEELLMCVPSLLAWAAADSRNRHSFTITIITILIVNLHSPVSSTLILIITISCHHRSPHFISVVLCESASSV
jgi:hypothetical protein